MSHQPKTFVTEPNEHDVLYGRGNAVNFHPGNIHFRSLVELLRVDYDSAAKSDRPLFSKVVLKTIRNCSPPGRFLKRDTSTCNLLWYEVEDKAALSKIRQALRETYNKPKEELISGTPEADEDIDDSILNEFLTGPLQFASSFGSDELSFWEEQY